MFDHGVFPLQHACVLAGAAMLVRALAKGWLGNLCAVLSCKEMRCHENKNLAMLACAACAREKQHLLGQLLKEIQINHLENAMPNTGCNLFLSGWVTGHPYSSHCLTVSQNQYKDMDFFGDYVTWML